VNILTGTNIREAKSSEFGMLARIWFDGWQDAHARIVPAKLARLRTLKSFEERLRAASAGVRVAGTVGATVGFYYLKSAELYQFYVSSNARDSGIAAVLMADAEARLGESGVHTAWLACAIGNDRAARFHEKCGWVRTGIVTDDVEPTIGVRSDGFRPRGERSARRSRRNQRPTQSRCLAPRCFSLLAASKVISSY
jgi:GNAT superfamily N-acetyltransferase